MGLLQKACETYDHYSARAGVAETGHETLAPISHIITSAQLEITLNEAGSFVSASAVDKSEPKIIIPVTEDSGGRTSSPCPHPLCDQLSYLAPYDAKKNKMYIEQLSDWAASEYTHPKLNPILTYVKGGTILQDLLRAGLIKLDKKGRPEKEKLMVRWRVLSGVVDVPDACWQDQTLFQSFIRYYRSKQQDGEAALCMIEGTYTTSAKQHPKGIIPINGNAKLISANDKSGFTYRGRFTEDWQAGTVSYEASQKAHNALRWIAAEQGYQVVFGGRTFLCWNPHGIRFPNAVGPFRRGPAKPVPEWSLYKKDLMHTLNGWKSELPENNADVVIAAFDAATTGRLALTYYNELQGSDFLQRLHDWDEHCCWFNGSFGIQSPALYQIVNCAFGTQRTEKGKTDLKTDDRVMKQQMQRLVSCRVDRAMFPTDIKQALFNRAITPQAYERSVWLKLLFTTCAVIKKYDFDHKGEIWEMALEPNKADRSYQYGRLLAVMEKIERDTYNESETREPNAVRMMSVYAQRPEYARMVIWEQLKRAYLPRLTPASRSYYDRLMGEIMENLSSFEAQKNQRLGDSFMMGYYLQRNELYKSKKQTNNEEE